MIKKLLYIMVVTIFSSAILVSCNISDNNTNNGDIISTGVNSNDINSKNETLVVYFSQTGITKEKANIIREYLYADSYEIKLKKPYSFEDVNNEPTSRAYVEQQDLKYRPEIDNLPKNLNKYKYIFIGFPIWYGKAPRVIFSFLDSFHLNNKKIIFFATSDNDDIIDSVEEIKTVKRINEKNIIDEKRFDKNASVKYVTDWIESLNLDIKYDDYIDDQEYETMPPLPDEIIID